MLKLTPRKTLLALGVATYLTLIHIDAAPMKFPVSLLAAFLKKPWTESREWITDQSQCFMVTSPFYILGFWFAVVGIARVCFVARDLHGVACSWLLRGHKDCVRRAERNRV